MKSQKARNGLRQPRWMGLGWMLLVAAAAFYAPAARAAEEQARRVIMFIGDGMGAADITAGRLYAGGSTGRLAMEKLPVTGFSRTYSSNQFVTDSAAGGTALAAGVKTYNGSINMTDKRTDPSGQSRPLQLLTDLAKAQGKSIGVISTAKVTDATPACYYAHVAKRSAEPEIAAQSTKAGLTLLMGGGRSEFHGKDWTDPETAKTGTRGDGKNLVKAMQDEGYTYVESADQLKKIDLAKDGLKLLGLFEYGHMQFDLDRDKDKLGEPSLADMVACAIKILSRNPKGYFLMVEGAKIDKAAHVGDARDLVGDLVALDRAIGAAVEATGGDTLIVVTADHETGGVALNGYAPREMIAGAAVLGTIPNLNEDAKPIAPAATTATQAAKAVAPIQRKVMTFSGSNHTAVDVPVLATGPGALKFTGYMNNNEIAWKIAELMGTSFNEAANIENRNAVK